MYQIDLNSSFPILSEILNYDNNLGVYIDGKKNKKKSEHPYSNNYLKYYFVNDDTKKIIENNIEWAAGKKDKPLFQFAYLMLPTLCNQACEGCFMGQNDNKKKKIKNNHFSFDELSEIFGFLKDHGGEAVVYGGEGELFTWDRAFDFIYYANEFNLKVVVFTNGTLLNRKKIEMLYETGTVLIFSLRDTIEKYHNKAVHRNNFIRTLQSIEFAVESGMNNDNRLAVEIPVTNFNENRISNDFLPVMRTLHITPLVEEYIQISIKSKEELLLHNFTEARSFFENSMSMINNKKVNTIEIGSRILFQPKCERSLYSFEIFSDREIVDCYSHSKSYGNIKYNSIKEIIYSNNFKQNILNHKYCPCSVFYTKSDSDIPCDLPKYLRN